SGPEFANTAPRVVGKVAGAVETGSLPPNYARGIATANGAGGIAITNYNAVIGTHIDPTKKSASDPNNGAMAFQHGRKLASLVDGTAKVPIVAETRETRISSWYDGTMNWLVAARHSNPSAGTTAIVPATKIKGELNGWRYFDSWVVGADGTPETG